MAPTAVDTMATIEALSSLATVLRTSGSLLPPATRLAIDTSLMRYVSPAVAPLAPAVVRAGRTSALRAVVASLGAPHRTQSPMLPHALCAFRAAMADADPKVVAEAVAGLAMCEALIHPRAPPLHVVEPQPTVDVTVPEATTSGALFGAQPVANDLKAPQQLESPQEISAGAEEEEDTAAAPFLPELQGRVGAGQEPKLGLGGNGLPMPAYQGAAKPPERDVPAPPPPTTRSSPRLAATSAATTAAATVASAPAAAEGDSDSDDLGDLVDADPDDEE